MVRLTIFTALATLVVLSTTTALTFDDDVRIRNRKEGGWLNGRDTPKFAPIVVEEKPAGAFGVWAIRDADEESHFFYNKGSSFPVLPTNQERQVMTSGVRIVPSYLRLESVDVSGYHIKDVKTSLYWTRVDNEVFLRPLDPSDDNQIWDFLLRGFDDEFAFWE
ncbi:hypothetical protein DFQ27_005986 [Actinomortierella ambigua]|uniref:Uncharacterized protein n=1 Tax=Actinomortierella ambigua TaxID=1343610 RepID=A0A9P6Q0Q6_9FUNG|nr:hypothetical protein DFQ27_005986 [Actinomortierella ambigua]